MKLTIFFVWWKTSTVIKVWHLLKPYNYFIVHWCTLLDFIPPHSLWMLILHCTSTSVSFFSSYLIHGLLNTCVHVFYCGTFGSPYTSAVHVYIVGPCPRCARFIFYPTQKLLWFPPTGLRTANPIALTPSNEILSFPHVSDWWWPCRFGRCYFVHKHLVYML